MSRIDSHLVAICLPMDPDRADDLEPVGVATTSSSYTEASPRPGTSVPTDDRARLVPVISGGQGSDLELVVLAAGNVDLSADASVHLGYRFAGDTEAETRGWFTCGLLTGWGAPASGANAFLTVDICALPNSQKLVMVYSSDFDTDQGIAVFDPVTFTWSADNDALPDVGNDGSDCILALPDDRVMLIAAGHVYRSDDAGSTWQRHSTAVFGSFDHDGSGSIDRARMAYSNGEILYVGVNISAGANRLYQLASDNLLGTLGMVYDSDSTGVGYGVSVQAMPAGFIVGYLRHADDHMCCRLLASAWQPFTEATEVVIRAAACADGIVVADPDGLLWCYVNDATNLHQLYVYVSTDAGATWTLLDHGGVETASSSADYWFNLAGCSWMGGVAVAHTYVASTEGTAGETVAVASFGGWSTLTDWGAPASPLYDATITLTNRTGFGPSSSTTISYVPMELPANSGLFTSTGAGVQSVGSGELTVTTVGGQRYYSASLGANGSCCAMYLVRVASGGSYTTDDIVFGLRAAQGTDDREITIRHDTAGFRLIDANSGGTLATVSLDLTTAAEIAVRLGQALADAAVWYRRLGSTTWTEAWSGTLTNDTSTPSATGLLIFGHFAASVASSRWSLVRYGEGMFLAQGLMASSASTAFSVAAQGRPMSPMPVPLHHEAGDGTRSAWLSVAGGTASLNEVYDVPADHDYPIEHVLPTLSPSPAERWRSTSTDQQLIVWDYGVETWVGSSFALLIQRANFRQAILQYYNGSSWQTAGTLDLATGFTGLSWSLVGDTLVPASSGASAGRYMHEGEMAGGMAIITTGSGATPIGRRIIWNSAGSWGPSSTTANRPRLILEGIDATEDASGTDLQIVAPSGVLIVHPSAAQVRRYWRVNIVASQTTPSGVAYYEAGTIAPMAVRALGAPPDWGWTRERAPNVEIRRSRYGTTRARKLGPPIDTWTLGWPSGVDLYHLRNTDPPDYLGAAGGLPLATAEDVPWLLGGLLELAESGAVPVLALAAVPSTSGTTITDPSLWHYGRLTSSVRQDHIVGTEGESEVVRVPDLVVEGIV